jgi:ferrous iron transport protein B
VVIALNKSDVNAKKHTHIDVNTLSMRLGCPVVETVSTTREGLNDLMNAAIKLAGSKQKAPYTQEAMDMTDKKAVHAADRRRFAFVNELVKVVERRKIHAKDRTKQDKFDVLLTNRWVGIPFFALIMYLVFQISQVWVGPLFADGMELSDGTVIPGLVTLIDQLGAYLAGILENAGTSPLLQALLIDGIIGGVGAVVGFLPLVMVMYFFIALLEDCGYMARVAVLLDPIFKKVGLSGKSVIPFVIGIGCAVPGVMACRTIRDEKERRATAMLAPFMPCGAKIPLIALFAGAFFESSGWVSFIMYITGIVIIFLGALLVNGITGRQGKKSYFIIELPEYKFPSLWGAFKSMCSRGWSYVVKAATVILLCNTAVHIMQSFDWSFQLAESAETSILATIASPFAYLLVPVVGVLSWELAAAAITGFIAKENVVGTLAVCFVGLENLIDTEEFAILEGAGAEVAGVMAITKVAALAYLMFNLFSPPCFAAIGSMNAEIGSKKWLWGGIGLQIGVGFTVGYLVYTVGSLILYPEALNVMGAIAGGIAVILFAAILAYLIQKASKSASEEKVLSVSR